MFRTLKDSKAALSASHRAGVVAFVIILALLAFAFQGSRGIYSPDEGYYISIAQAMVATGDYLMPRLHHDLWLDKPPVSFWGIAAGLWALGHNEWGARAFHGLCYVLTALVVYLLGCSLSSKRDGLLAGITYATMVLPFVAANVVTPDTPLTLWTTVAFYCFWKSVEPQARRVAMWKLVMCAAFGLGFLTKGPAALVPSAAMFVFLLLQRRTGKYFLTPWALPGLGLFCILGLSWYAYVGYNVPSALDYFWDNQVLGRTISTKYARNPGLKGVWIYLPVVLGGALPWSIAWLRALWRGGRRVFGPAARRAVLDDPGRLLLATWITVPLLLLCLASSRLPLYTLPIFPALALATALIRNLHTLEEPWRDNVLGLSPRMVRDLVPCIVLLLGFKLAASYYPNSKDMRALFTVIENRLPDETYEIVCVNEHLEGLGFYTFTDVERVTTKERVYPFFVLPESLDEEVKELRTSDFAHLFVCWEADMARTVRAALREQSIPFRETALPFHRYLFVCKPLEKQD